MSKVRTAAYIDLLIVAAIWGVATPVVKFTLGGIPPSEFLSYRFLISGIIGLIAIYPFVRRHKRRLIKNSPRIILYSIFATTISLGLLFLGLEKTTVLDTVLISSVSPLITALFGVWFLGDRITSKEKKGMAIAFIGSLIIIAEPIMKHGIDIGQLTGNILVFGYLITNAYSAVLAKKLSRNKIPGSVLSHISFIIGFITILPMALISTTVPGIIDEVANLALPYHLGVWYMALISGTLAYALWIRGQKSIEISEAGVFAYLIPIFAAPLAVLWLGETITTPFIIGSVVVAIGVYIAETKK